MLKPGTSPLRPRIAALARLAPPPYPSGHDRSRCPSQADAPPPPGFRHFASDHHGRPDHRQLFPAARHDPDPGPPCRPRLLGRSAAGQRQGRAGRRPRRLVRRHRPVPPPAWSAHPAHRYHPERKGAAGPGARPLRVAPRGQSGGGEPRALPLRRGRLRARAAERSGDCRPAGAQPGGDDAAPARDPWRMGAPAARSRG